MHVADGRTSSTANIALLLCSGLSPFTTGRSVARIWRTNVHRNLPTAQSIQRQTPKADSQMAQSAVCNINAAPALFLCSKL